jgi:hypothetical protein
MSNVQTAFGFRHIGFRPGASPDYQLSTRLVSSANTTSIYFGDPVTKVAGTQYITQATVTNAMIDGIFQGCMLIPSTGGAPTWSPFYPGAAGADVTAYVMEAGEALFMAAAFSTNISSTAIGAAISFHTGTGSTVGGGFSGYTLDQSLITTTATVATTLPFQIVSLYGMPGQSNFGGVGNGSDYSSAYNWVIVAFNNQRYNSLASF